MNIIRDEETHGLMMIPLFIDWNIRRCNYKDCKEKPNTIITGTEAGRFGLCEDHFQLANVPDGATLNLEFDDYKAI